MDAIIWPLSLCFFSPQSSVRFRFPEPTIITSLHLLSTNWEASPADCELQVRAQTALRKNERRGSDRGIGREGLFLPVCLFYAGG